jgi:hypothetical protein
LGYTPLMKESRKHIEAFEIYYAMGDSRTLVRLGKAIGVSSRTLEGWSSDLGWAERIKDRDAFISEALKTEMTTVMAQTRLQTLQMIRKTLEKTMKLAKDRVTVIGSTITPRDVTDVEKIVKTYQLISGGPTENQKVTVGGVLRMPAKVSEKDWESGGDN